MTSINLLAIGMIVLGAGSVHLATWLAGGHTNATTSIACGVMLVLLDIAWRSRHATAEAKRRWFSNECGGAISIFPVWGIGLFGIVYGALSRTGYQL